MSSKSVEAAGQVLDDATDALGAGLAGPRPANPKRGTGNAAWARIS